MRWRLSGGGAAGGVCWRHQLGGEGPGGKTWVLVGRNDRQKVGDSKTGDKLTKHTSYC